MICRRVVVRRSRAATLWLGIAAAISLLTSACATPIGVTRGSTQEAHRILTATVLSAGTPSGWSTQFLHRTNQFERFEEDPEGVLRDLRKLLEQDATPRRLVALSELSFLHAERSGKREHYLAAATYAYAFLFPEDGTPAPDALDPRTRLAADLYNRGLTRGLASSQGEAEEVALRDGTLPLPFGELTLAVNPPDFLWGGYRFKRFIPVGEYEIRGLRNRYRQAGVGVPLAAELEPADADTEDRARIPPRTKVPVTAFVRLAAPRRAVVDGKLQGRVELYPADAASTVNVAGRDVPLEMEPTAALAYGLEGAPVWDFEVAGFRFAERPLVTGDGLFMLQPYRPGRIPVVLVHGTASSPARWAEMVNELMYDPGLRGRFQIWGFMYNTGQPILYSAYLMRRALASIVQDLDPAGRDPALRRMVVIGHSQGGLLTKLMAISSGNRFWGNVSKKPFDEVFTPGTRPVLHDGMFFEPVPTVERVIFIATPHRGSYRATGWVPGLIRRLVRLPGTMVTGFQDLLRQEEFAELRGTRLPTSVDNMSPGHPFIRTLADTPVDPRITAHSIIAVRGDYPFIGKTDGVVAYESAHIEGVESERVIRSSHSVQSHPDAIEEVRRILVEHAKNEKEALSSGASTAKEDGR